MTNETYSPANARPTPFAGFHQVVGDPLPSPDSASGTLSCRNSPAEQCRLEAREALELLIVRCGGLAQQLRTFRNTLPQRLDGVAWHGFKAIARTTPDNLERDIDRLCQVETSLIALSDALPKQMNDLADRGLRILIDHYKFVLSRESDPI